MRPSFDCDGYLNVTLEGTGVGIIVTLSILHSEHHIGYISGRVPDTVVEYIVNNKSRTFREVSLTHLDPREPSEPSLAGLLPDLA